MTTTLVERDDGLVTLTFNRPAKKNALNSENWDALDRTLIEVASNPDDRALLLTGAGGNFSAGADLSGGLSGGSKHPERSEHPAHPEHPEHPERSEQRSGLTGRERQSVLHEMRAVGEIINRLHRLPKPTIAAVDGVVFGVSLGLALACDLVVASDRARFCEVFVKRGLALDGGTSWTLPRQVGLRRAKQIAFMGDVVSADEAVTWGLINEVVPPEELMKVATGWGRRLASGPTTALSLIKRLLDGSDSLTFEQSLEEEARAQHISFTTSDMAEGIQAFLERREPRFTGR
jgi:2-(1,2-epoxy-1,2-dihydrophenyl)acetyl-CoA isomerase